MDKIEMLEIFEQAFQKVAAPRFDAMDNRLDKIQTTLNQFQERFDYIYQELVHLGMEYSIINDELKRID